MPTFPTQLKSCAKTNNKINLVTFLFLELSQRPFDAFIQQISEAYSVARTCLELLPTSQRNISKSYFSNLLRYQPKEVQ